MKIKKPWDSADGYDGYTLELEKAAEHGDRHGVKIKKPWDPADGYE